MNNKKTVLIVTDGSEKVTIMAESITRALKGKKVTIKTGSEFAGTDLLPADFLFIGCDQPSPESFGYLDRMLQHINLAGRGCGVFSPESKKAALYLTKMLKSSEVSLKAEPLFAAESGEIPEWVSRITKG